MFNNCSISYNYSDKNQPLIEKSETTSIKTYSISRFLGDTKNYPLKIVLISKLLLKDLIF